MEDTLPIIAIVISVLGFLSTLYKMAQDSKESERRRLDREAKQNERIITLETKINLFWKVVETNVGQMLKSPTHETKDMLLDKLAHRELNLKEAELLRSILTDEMQLRGRDNGVLAYALIIGRLEQIIFDLRSSECSS